MAWQFEQCRAAGGGTDYRKGTTPGGNSWRSTRARAETKSAGKWYYPVHLTEGTGDDFAVGLATDDAQSIPGSYLGVGLDSVGFYISSSGGWTNNGTVAPNAKPTYGSWITVALDIDAGEARLFDNAGVQIGETVTGLSAGEWLPAYSGIRSSSASDNFIAFIDLAGAESNATPPAGYSIWPAWGLVDGAPRAYDDTHQAAPLPARDLGELQKYRAPFGFSGGTTPSDTSLARFANIRDFFGPGVIEGTVTTLKAPSADVVRLYDRDTGWKVAEQRSARDGSYRFQGLAIREYILVGVDRQRQYEIVGRDIVTPDDPTA